MSTYDDPVQGRGGVVFAAAMMIVIGVFQAIEGLVAIFDEDWYVVTRPYTFDDEAGSGHVHLTLPRSARLGSDPERADLAPGVRTVPHAWGLARNVRA